MARYTLKILQQMLQDFSCVSNHFGTLYTKGLRLKLITLENNKPIHDLLLLMA